MRGGLAPRIGFLLSAPKTPPTYSTPLLSDSDVVKPCNRHAIAVSLRLALRQNLRVINGGFLSVEGI